MLVAPRLVPRPRCVAPRGLDARPRPPRMFPRPREVVFATAAEVLLADGDAVGPAAGAVAAAPAGEAVGLLTVPVNAARALLLPRAPLPRARLLPARADALDLPRDADTAATCVEAACGDLTVAVDPTLAAFGATVFGAVIGAEAGAAGVVTAVSVF